MGRDEAEDPFLDPGKIGIGLRDADHHAAQPHRVDGQGGGGHDEGPGCSHRQWDSDGVSAAQHQTGGGLSHPGDELGQSQPGLYIAAHSVEQDEKPLDLFRFLYGGQQGYGGIGMNGGNYIPGYGYQAARRDPVPYNNMYQQPPYPGYANPAPGPANWNNRIGLNDISFDTRDDAYLVLDRMNRELQRYHRVRVADFYIYAGITGQEGNWTLQSTGWTDLSSARPVPRTDGRWMIEFPPTIAL